MYSKYNAQFKLPRIVTYTPKLIVKTMIKQERNFELTSGVFVGHANLSLAKSQATILRISVGNCVCDPEIELIEVVQLYTIASWEEVIFARA